MAKRKYTASYLNALRNRVINRFIQNKTDNEDTGLDLVFSKGKRNSTINAFIIDISISIDRVFDGQTLANFFYREVKDGKEIPLIQDQSFDSSTIDDLDLYADIIRSGDQIIFSTFSRIALKGSFLIDSNFKNSYESENSSYNRLDFYLSKDDEDLQWYGTVHGWDYPRKMLDDVQNRILACFKTNSKVAAVVHGDGGSGKSLFLRKLSLRLTSKVFKVLWVSELMAFYEFDLKHISKCTDAFLIIIEDWYILRENKTLLSNFLAKVQKTKNVRIVIGDRSPIEEKQYYNYLYEKGNFEIDNSENINIIKKAVKFVDAWKVHTDSYFSSPSFYNAPIYMTFFVLTRVSDKAEKTKDIVSIYRGIIQDDFNRISETYPGLSLAFYYWAQINRTNRIFISWSALLKIADHFDNNTFASRTLWDFDIKNPIIKIFSHYISVKKFTTPDFSDLTYFSFHHEILTDEGISKIQFKGWKPFHPNIRYEFAETLWKANQKISAYDIISVLFLQEESKMKRVAGGYTVLTGFEIKEINKLRDKKKLIGVGLTHYIWLESFVCSLYENANISDNEQYWLDNLWYLFTKTKLHPKSRFIIVKKILDMGCKNECVLKSYEWIKNGDIESLGKYFLSKEINFRYTYQRKIDGTIYYSWVNH